MASARQGLVVHHGGKTVPLNAQSIELSDKSRVSAFVEGAKEEKDADQVDGRLVKEVDERRKTMYEVLRIGVNMAGDKPAIGARTGE